MSTSPNEDLPIYKAYDYKEGDCYFVANCKYDDTKKDIIYKNIFHSQCFCRKCADDFNRENNNNNNEK